MATFPSILAITRSLVLLLTIINQSCSSARTIGNATPTPHHHHHHYNNNHHPKITFLMQNVLNVTHPTPNPKFTTQIPFPKPIGYFPPKGGIPLPQSNPIIPTIPIGFSSKTLDFSTVGLPFQAKTILRELKFGSVTKIDEQLFEGITYGSMVVGKAKGQFVASSEDGNSHMVAITTHFGKRESKDELKFFGIYKRDVAESHIAVVDGTGKFNGANGYAVIKAVKGESSELFEENKIKKLLSFSVYLS